MGGPTSRGGQGEYVAGRARGSTRVAEEATMREAATYGEGAWTFVGGGGGNDAGGKGDVWEHVLGGWGGGEGG